MAVQASAQRIPRVRSAALEALLHLAVPVAALALLLGPMAFDRGTLGIDWFSHLWYVWHQSEALRDGGLPTLYAHNGAGVFDPHFAYYAGNLYALTGALALLLGSPQAALVTMFAVGFACAYGGLYWLGRLAGVGAWPAHAPALVFVTSSYYLATLYGGGFGEVLAVSAIPLALASGWAVARADRLPRGPALALAWSTLLVTGSHNLTLVWATTVALIVAAGALAIAPGLRRAAWGRVAIVAVPAALLNAWFLLPTLVHQHGTAIAADRGAAEQALRDTMFMVKADRLLNLGRGTIDASVPYYVTALPLLAIAWAVVALVLARARHRAPAFRAAVALLALAAVLSVVVGSLSLLLALPSPWGLLQLGWRLEAYVTLAVAGAMIAALVLLNRTRGAYWAWALVPLALVLVALGHQQATPEIADTGPSYQRATIPYNSARPVQGSADYAEASVPLAQDPGGPRIRIDPAHPTAAVNARPGLEQASNLVAAPTYVKLTGARITGRLPDGTAVLAVDDGATRVSARAVHPWPLKLGIALSLLGLAGLVAALALRPGARAPTSRPPRAARPRRPRPR